MSLYLAAYDIADHRRRCRVARVLGAFGNRVQRSVFEVWLEPREIPDLQLRIGPLLDVQDEFDLYPIDERGPRTRVSWQRPPDRWGPALLA